MRLHSELWLRIMQQVGYDERRKLCEVLGWLRVPRFRIQGTTNLLSEWTTQVKRVGRAAKGKDFKVSLVINYKVQITREVRENCMMTSVWFPGNNLRFDLHPELPEGIWIVWNAERVLLKYEYVNVSWKVLEQVGTNLEAKWIHRV